MAATLITAQHFCKWTWPIGTDCNSTRRKVLLVQFFYRDDWYKTMDQWELIKQYYYWQQLSLCTLNIYTFEYLKLLKKSKKSQTYGLLAKRTKIFVMNKIICRTSSSLILLKDQHKKLNIEHKGWFCTLEREDKLILQKSVSEMLIALPVSDWNKG